MTQNKYRVVDFDQLREQESHAIEALRASREKLFAWARKQGLRIEEVQDEIILTKKGEGSDDQT